MTIPAASLRRAVDLIIPFVGLFALHLLLVGHEEPGGGFVAGLLVAGALAINTLAHDAAEQVADQSGEADESSLGELHLPDGGRLIAVGLVAAATVALVPVLLGNAPLDHGGLTFDLGIFGKLKLTSVLVFDLGVFAIVLGFSSSVLDRVREVLS